MPRYYGADMAKDRAVKSIQRLGDDTDPLRLQRAPGDRQGLLSCSGG